MPPAKSKFATEDSRSDASTVRERQIAAAAHARKSKAANGAAAAAAAAQSNGNGSSLKDLALASADASNNNNNAAAAAQSQGMSWNTAPLSLLNSYRVAHNLSTPAAFTTPLNQALLTNPGVGRQSPTMARKKERRRVSKEQLALAVRKNFNAQAVNEIDVVCELVYKVRNRDKAFRLRSAPGIVKK